jgi:uncharacterized damage-inducible protein DinB
MPVPDAHPHGSAAHVLALLRYTAWAHARMLGALRAALAEAPAPPGAPLCRACRLADHLVRAERIWRGRVEDTADARVAVWPEAGAWHAPEAAALDALAEGFEASSRAWQGLVTQAGADGLGRRVRYRTSRGTAYATPLSDIVTHVAHHGTHHRAQIALLLREAGHTPPATDFIAYVRLRDAASPDAASPDAASSSNQAARRGEDGP